MSAFAHQDTCRGGCAEPAVGVGPEVGTGMGYSSYDTADGRKLE